MTMGLTANEVGVQLYRSSSVGSYVDVKQELVEWIRMTLPSHQAPP